MCGNATQHCTREGKGWVEKNKRKRKKGPFLGHLSIRGETCMPPRFEMRKPRWEGLTMQGSVRGEELWTVREYIEMDAYDT
jgi:hypothetical protein